jgi:EmrB/QacA subfamily drug resistance transporter
MVTVSTVSATASPWQRRGLLLGCCFSLGITSLDVTIVNVALPTLSRSLHTELTGLQWVIDGYMLVLASLLVLAGSLGDRIGRRAMLRTGLLLFGLASAACSLAPTVEWLVAFRVVQGVSAALLVPNALSTLTNVITDSGERARAIGVWSSVFGVAAAAGPIFGGLLVEGPGWRAIFWVNLPVVAITLLLVSRYAPETKAPHPRGIDLPGQGLILVTVAAATAAFIEAPSQGWTAPVILALFALALLALAGFIAVERRVFEPLIDLHFFSSPPFSGAAAIATLAFAVFSGFLLINTLYLQEVRGASPLRAGVETLPALGVMALASPVVGRVIAWRGSRALLAWAGVMLAGGTAVLAFEQPGSPYILLAGAYVLVGLGLALVNPPITHAAVSGMPAAQAGVASAIASSTRQLGNVLGVAVLGSMLTSLLAARLITLVHASDLAASTRRQLLVASRHGALLHIAAARGHARALLDGAFVDASHAGWWLAAGLGCVIAVVGYTTAGRHRAPAARP